MAVGADVAGASLLLRKPVPQATWAPGQRGANNADFATPIATGHRGRSAKHGARLGICSTVCVELQPPA